MVFALYLPRAILPSDHMLMHALSSPKTTRQWVAEKRGDHLAAFSFLQ
jgi:hypothetical protein